MTPKDQMLYDIAQEQKERLLKVLPEMVDGMKVSEVITLISRAEYKRGKFDGGLK